MSNSERVDQPSAGSRLTFTQRRVHLFGIAIDAIDMDQAVAALSKLLRRPNRDCHYVVTPNVDHVVQLQSDQDLAGAYAEASLVVADGWPLVAASRLLRRPLPERVAGSDLVPRLLAQPAEQPLRVFLLGAAPGVGLKAKANIESRWTSVLVCGTHSPPFGFEHNSRHNDEIIQRVNDAQPDLLVVGLGAPKQEIWLRVHRRQLSVKVAIAAGATIDFLAGKQKRAPHWVRKAGLEWLHRALSQPRRLAGRYLRGAWAFPKIVLAEGLKSARQNHRV